MRTDDGHAARPATISACVIARDEALSLPDCLASLGFCDEIVLVDSGSTDATLDIARGAGARVIEQAWLGFAAQRNVALQHARCDWVIELDADERVTAQLQAEIRAFLEAPPAGIELAALPYREILLGHALGPSAKYPRYLHRMLLRGAYRHDEARTVHEGIIPEGPVHPFEGQVEHILARSWGEAIGDAWRYARLEAGQMEVPLTLRGALAGAILRPCAKLSYRLVVDGGWRDGRYGFARISLDCATDSIVWARHLLGRRGRVRGRSGISANVHYGNRDFRRGELRVVGLAAGAADAARASEWLAAAQAGGADVSLVCVAPERDERVRVRRLASSGPLSVIRALDAEWQLRPYDALVTFGRRSRLLVRGVPRGLRGSMTGIGEHSDPRAVDWRTRRQ